MEKGREEGAKGTIYNSRYKKAKCKEIKNEIKQCQKGIKKAGARDVSGNCKEA